MDIDLLLRPILHPEKALDGRALLASKQSILRCLQHLSTPSCGNYLFLLSSNTPQDLKEFFGKEGEEALVEVRAAPLPATLRASTYTTTLHRSTYTTSSPATLVELD